MPGLPTTSIALAINAFLGLLKEEPNDEDARLLRLCEALDGLVAEYHRAPEVEPDTEEVSASVPYEPLAARASASFPELGLYADVDPSEVLPQVIGFGDAIDDLADIARDLTGVLGLINRGATNDAIWEFRFGYQTHWGRHLHNLRRYLHVIMH